MYSTIIIDKETALQIQSAMLFQDCPFKQASVIRLSDDRYFVNFNEQLSNTTIFKYGVYLAEKNNLPLPRFNEDEN